MYQYVCALLLPPLNKHDQHDTGTTNVMGMKVELNRSN